MNILGTLCFEEDGGRLLEYRLLEGSCRTGEVVGYLDLLAEKAELEGKPVVGWSWTTPPSIPRRGGTPEGARVGGEGA